MGLLRFNNLARRVAIVIAVVGIVFLIPEVSAETGDFSLRFLYARPAVITRVIIVWYLWQACAAEKFLRTNYDGLIAKAAGQGRRAEDRLTANLPRSTVPCKFAEGWIQREDNPCSAPLAAPTLQTSVYFVRPVASHSRRDKARQRGLQGRLFPPVLLRKPVAKPSPV